MKFYKCLVLGAAMLFATGCTTNQGVALTVDNASTYIEPLVENTGNADFDASSKTIKVHLYPSVAQGKLFSSDIKGKCSLSIKYGSGFFDWSEPEQYSNVAFAFKTGGTGESGTKQADYLEASFTYTYTGEFGFVNVYNVTITEISGHMQP